MKRIVEWKKTATDELTAMWLDADSRDLGRITTAAREVDRLLQTDPYGQGESRDADRRVMFVAPLAVNFRINAQMDKVEVVHIWQFY